MEIFVHDLMIKYSKSSWFIVMDEKKELKKNLSGWWKFHSVRVVAIISSRASHDW